MNERVMQFRVGLVILATILIGAILVMSFLGSTPLFQRSYTVYIRFSEAPDVTRGTPIRKAGIRIGQVRSVEFGENDEGVIVTTDIEQDRHVYSDEQCEVMRSLLPGDTSLEFAHQPGTPRDRTALPPGAVVQGRIGPDMTGALSGLQSQTVRTLDTLDKAGQEVQTVLLRIDHLMAANENRISRLIDETDETMKLMQETLRSTNDVVGDPNVRAQLKQTLREMPEILVETKATIKEMKGTFASMNQNMQNLEGFTKPLGDRGELLVNEAARGMGKLNALADNLLRFSQDLNDSQGSLGALMHDKELYQRVNHLVKEIDDLARDLKPVVSNMQVFSDKIARHPGDLGVRGALKKDSGLKDDMTGGADGAEPSARRWPIGGSGTWNLGGAR